jgi:hypothetical protein
VALFVALSGSAYAATALPANSVGTRQVINGSLLLKDVRPGQLGLDFVEARGPTVLACPRPINTLSCPSPASGNEFSFATCPAKYKAISGGWTTDNILEASEAGDRITVFYNDAPNPNTWEVAISNYSASPLKYHAIAVCVR